MDFEGLEDRDGFLRVFVDLGEALLPNDFLSFREDVSDGLEFWFLVIFFFLLHGNARFTTVLYSQHDFVAGFECLAYR